MIAETRIINVLMGRWATPEEDVPNSQVMLNSLSSRHHPDRNIAGAYCGITENSFVEFCHISIQTWFFVKPYLISYLFISKCVRLR